MDFSFLFSERSVTSEEQKSEILKHIQCILETQTIDMSVSDFSGHTALDMANCSSNKRVVQLLESHEKDRRIQVIKSNLQGEYFVMVDTLDVSGFYR